MCQKQGNIWYFGYHAGLDFSNGPPIVLMDGQTETLEGVASICDASGALQFYTDGVTVWNNQHQIMPNGNNLFGDKSSTQSAVIVPAIGDPSRYFVFTVDQLGGPKGLNYSVVNLSLDNGKGDVELKNIALHTPVTEKITAVRHCNGRDIWVIVHEWNSDAFYAYLVTASGISASPVISHTGTVVTGNIDCNIGYLKASPNGKKLASANALLGVDLLDFDNSTGAISNSTSLFLPSENYSDPYGVEFSPNSKLLYLTVSDYHLNISQHHNWLLQYDISQPTTSAIISSKKIIYTDALFYQTFAALQMAPDGKMYMVGETLPAISVINFPDSVGSSCQFQFNKLPLANNQYSHYGLPTFIQSYWDAGFTFAGGCSGDSMNFYYTRTPNVMSVKWDFDDLPSGSNNSSTLDSPSHVFVTPGLHNVKLIRYSACGADTITKQVYASVLNVALGPDTTICDAGTYQLSVQVQGNTSLLWQDGSTSSVFVASLSGLYWAEVRDNQTGCSKRDSVELVFANSPSFNLADTINDCQGQTVVLNPNIPGANYLWSTGATTSTLAVNQTGNYSVTVFQQGCQKEDTVRVNFLPSPFVNLGPDTILCENQTLLLNAQNQGSEFTWQNNSNAQTYLVTSKGKYWVKVTNNGCSNTDTISVDYQLKPVFTLGKDTVICMGQTIILQPKAQNNIGVSWLWNSGSNKPNLAVTQTGEYILQASNSCGSRYDTIEVSKGVCKLYVPNAFTPNNDGLNDMFRASFGENILQFSLEIYNRWGEKIFYTADISKGWDGKMRGIVQANGAYVWMIRYKLVNDTREYLLKGTVMLIR